MYLQLIFSVCLISHIYIYQFNLQINENSSRSEDDVTDVKAVSKDIYHGAKVKNAIILFACTSVLQQDILFTSLLSTDVYNIRNCSLVGGECHL